MEEEKNEISETVQTVVEVVLEAASIAIEIITDI